MNCYNCGLSANLISLPLVGEVFATEAGDILINGVCCSCLNKNIAQTDMPLETPECLLDLRLDKEYKDCLSKPSAAKLDKAKRLISDGHHLLVFHPVAGENEANNLIHADSILFASSRLTVSASKLTDAISDQLFSGNTVRRAAEGHRGVLGIVGLCGKAYGRQTESEIVDMLRTRKHRKLPTIVSIACWKFDAPVLDGYLKEACNLEVKCET